MTGVEEKGNMVSPSGKSRHLLTVPSSLSYWLTMIVSCGLTPSSVQALVTGKGSGLGGPSSMHTQHSNRPSRLPRPNNGTER